MKKRHVKFIWGAAEVIRGHWYLGLFGIYDRVEGKHDDAIAISVRGLLRWCGALAIAGYLAGATALFFFWEQNPYNLLTYADALLRPFRAEQVRDKHGQAFIAQGIDAMRQKHWAEGVAMLRQGLAYHPGDLKARLTLAQFYIAANQRPLALRLMQEGLTAEFPGRAFSQVLFDLAEQGEDYDLVVRTADRYLPLLTGDANLRDRRWLQGRLFAALLNSKHFTEARALADSEDPGDMASEHRVLALLGSGQPDAALAALEDWSKLPRADTGAILRLRARALREAKRFDEMDRALEELRARTPADPRPAVYAVVQRAMAGRTDSAADTLKDFLFRFSGTTQNLQMLAEPLAEIGQRDLLARVTAAASERGYPPAPYQVLVVQSAMLAGDWTTARRTLADMKAPAPRETVALLWREWMERLLAAASTTSDTAGPALVDYLRGRPWPIKIFRHSVDALRRGGRLETARDVLAVAKGAFPSSAWVESQTSEIARALVAAQPAAPAVVPGGNLPVERVYFQRLEDLLRDEQWALAEQLLRDARTAKPPPPWLQKRDAELRFAEIRVDQGRGAGPDLIAAAKLYLNGDAARSRQIIDIGRAIYAKGDTATAVALGREVLRATPDFAPAQRLLSEWQPKPAAKTPAKK